MFAFLAALSPRTWLYVGGGALILYLGVHLYNAGITHERDKARADVVNEGAAELKKQRDDFQAAMNQALDRQHSAEVAATAAAAKVVILDTRTAAAQTAQTATDKTVAAMPDPQVFGDIVRRINRRRPEDAAAAFYPDELRVIDSTLADAPYDKEQLQTANDKVAALTDKSTADDAEVGALKDQNATALSYAQDLHEQYVLAYNAAQPHVSLFVRIITLGLKRPKKLNLTPPESMTPPGKPKADHGKPKA
jgi:hypothetical protein